MTDVAIRVNGLGKRYRLGEQRGYKSLRESLARPFNRKSKVENRKSTELWALRDVSFTIRPGEVVGIIGGNGAGKSTLLKILARITEPTTGWAEVTGRVGSLLEVGTGFHPELTGRENVLLNGAILGMGRADILRQFDAIVAFAEVEPFIDTPVKHYSSGMAVRLAFAVAAHLQPEILLVDEVLAVGDVAFQKKCLGKMNEVSRQGRTVLFVSHNMSVITSLCSTGIHLAKGCASPRQPIHDVVAAYSQALAESPATTLPLSREGVTIHAFRVHQQGTPRVEYAGNQAIGVEIEFELTSRLAAFRLGFYIRSALGDLISRVLLADWEPQHSVLAAGRYRATAAIPPHTLVAGPYLIQLHASRYSIIDYRFDEELSQQIVVTASPEFNRAHLGERPFGRVLINPNWEITRQ